MLYRTDEDFNLFVGMVDAMAFLPINDLPFTIHFYDISPRPAEGEIIEYFDKIYVTGSFNYTRRGTHRNVLF